MGRYLFIKINLSKYFFRNKNDPGQQSAIFDGYAFQSSNPFYRICAFIGYVPVQARGVAQPGRALPSGGRGRKFESSHPDQLNQIVNSLMHSELPGLECIQST
jgi:hypothetical protein